MKRNDLSTIMRTAHQFIRIAGITLSEALKRAWANFKLRVAMSKGIVKFHFQKVDGTLREAYGTLCSKIVPATSGNDTRKPNDTVQVFFDTEVQAWRCFKKLNLVRIA
jgi:Protein of unknown function (DUF2693).